MLFVGPGKNNGIKVWRRNVKNKRRGNYGSMKGECCWEEMKDVNGSVGILYLLCLLLLPIHGW